MSPNLKRLIQFLKLALGLALLVAVVLLVDWPATWSYLRRADLRWLALGLLVELILLGVKSLRAVVLLRQLRVGVTARQAVEAYMAGQALNILLPLRGGELVRFGMLGEARPERATDSASTLVAEKVLDALALGALVGGLFIFYPAERAGAAMARVLPTAGGLLFLAVVLITAAFVLWPWVSEKLSRLPGGRLATLIASVDETVLRWRTLLRKPLLLMPVAALTTLNWLLMGAMNWIHFRVVGIQLGVAAAAFVLAMLMVGLLPALSPGNIGPFHFFAALGLRPFGVPVEQGVAFAILLHAVVTLPTLVIGGLIMLFPGRRPSLELTSEL
jgi:hypothetical protein